MSDLEFLGLNAEDRARIREVGFRVWLEEICEAQAARLAKKSKEKPCTKKAK